MDLRGNASQRNILDTRLPVIGTKQSSSSGPFFLLRVFSSQRKRTYADSDTLMRSVELAKPLVRLLLFSLADDETLGCRVLLRDVVPRSLPLPLTSRVAIVLQHGPTQRER